tara:strand:+ start:1113 stop:1751 length:639 start_codon:yes stop_codon:yes gene_type:complete
MKVLIACEESQTVAMAFRRLGHDAWSCDIQSPSGKIPQYHIQDDALKIAGNGEWDCLIGHPPCTYLSKAGARWMFKTAGNICKDRYLKCMQAKEFFMHLWEMDIKYICLENPTPLKICTLPNYSQAIQPYQFGHPYSKRTLLWLRGLPLLKYTNILGHHAPYLPSNTGGKKRGERATSGAANNAKARSKTFPGIADAMAEQWSHYWHTQGES